VEYVREVQQKEKGSKIVVFSQFISMLSTAEHAFNADPKHRITSVRYDGSMTHGQKQGVLDEFHSDPDVQVLLMSLKCGALGLNLTVANRVVMLDVWWNPFLEEQAIDRVHRLGQTKPVEVVRLTMEESVEDRIMLLQGHKRALAQACMTGEIDFEGVGGGGRLSVNDLKTLFNMHSIRGHGKHR
jgi:SNF2 family DNA or RNA helicase